MSEYDEENEETEEETPQQIEERIAARLGREYDTKLKSTTEYANLMADPQIRQIMEARKSGKNIQLVPEGQENKEPDPEPEWEDLDNKGLVKELLKRIPSVVQQTLEKSVNPLQDQFAGLKNYVEAQEEAKAKEQLDALSKKYPDFESMKPTMGGILKDNPGLSFEELYKVAKIRAGVPLGNTSSEKPTTESARLPRKNRKEPLPSGRKGFEQLLDEALEKTIE